MDIEALGDRHDAFTVRAGSSDSVHLALRQRCSSSSPRVRHDARLVLEGTFWVVLDTEFHLLPRGTEPFEPVPGVRFESTRVHTKENPRETGGFCFARMLLRGAHLFRNRLTERMREAGLCLTPP